MSEGDEIEFTVKIQNQSAARQTGKVRLTFNEASSERSVDAQLGNAQPELEFDIPARESRSYAWRLRVSDGLGILTYKAVAATTRLSDGEEGYLPVLPRRVLVTESLPLPIRGPATKEFRFAKLLESGGSDTLDHQSLVVQMASNPAWYAVLALPYLMEFPHECAEQVFNRFYANALARHIANSDPRHPPDLRAMEEHGSARQSDGEERGSQVGGVGGDPLVRQAQQESQARKNVGVLFDENRLNYETDRAPQKLAEQQLEDGAWSWFPGGRPNDFITLYIVTGFGRLRHLGVDLDAGPAIRALSGWTSGRSSATSASRSSRNRKSMCRQPSTRYFSTAAVSSSETDRSPPNTARRWNSSSVRRESIGSRPGAGRRKGIWHSRSSGSTPFSRAAIRPRSTSCVH